jgi:hypothetical protein
MLPIEVANVERIDGYLGVVSALLEVLTDAAREPGLWPRARCRAILADCRKRFVARMRRVSWTDGTESEIGFDCLYDYLWELINPAPQATHTELVCRVKKARWVAIALERGLSAMVVLERFCPVEIESISRYPEGPDALPTRLDEDDRIPWVDGAFGRRASPIPGR